MQRDKITIIDFGGQYAHLIANRVRRLGVYTEIVLNDVSTEELKGSKGIIFSGGPQSVNTDSSPTIDEKIFDLGIPILGICYGHQIFAYKFGGNIGSIPEYGKCNLSIINKSSIFEGCKTKEVVWQNHGDAVLSAPDGFSVIASTENNEVSAMQHNNNKWYSVQFHPEVTHSGDLGKIIFKNFIFNICKATKSWSLSRYLEELKTSIKEDVGDKNVFLLVSGGVDSSVCFALLNEVLGSDRVLGLHIDNGFMRKNESALVKEILNKKGFLNLEVYQGSNDFLDSLEEVYKPEEKRKIIGKVYLEVKDKALKKFDLDPEKWILAQGTIYPDTIESGGTKNSDTIKTHHNRVDQIQELIQKGLIIEPIKELYKDEVRELGHLLGLPAELTDRHPFPGPGLAIRALCNDSEKNAIITKKEDFKSEYKIDILDIRSVGIKGDARSYAHPAVLSGGYNYDVLTSMMTEITNKNPNINRVIYNVLNCDLLETRLFQKYLDETYMNILREADEVVMNLLSRHNLMNKIWQCPTVILPFGKTDQPYSIIIRPIDSIDAMSAKAFPMRESLLKIMAEDIQKRCSEVYAVFYDLTSKPPGTIEWE